MIYPTILHKPRFQLNPLLKSKFLSKDSCIINFNHILSICLFSFCSFYYKILLEEDCSYNQLVFIYCKKPFLDGAHNVLADEVLEVATIVSSERASP